MRDRDRETERETERQRETGRDRERQGETGRRGHTAVPRGGSDGWVLNAELSRGVHAFAAGRSGVPRVSHGMPRRPRGRRDTPWGLIGPSRSEGRRTRGCRPPRSVTEPDTLGGWVGGPPRRCRRSPPAPLRRRIFAVIFICAQRHGTRDPRQPIVPSSEGVQARPQGPPGAPLPSRSRTRSLRFLGPAH